MNKFEHLILKGTCLKGLLLFKIDLLLANHKQSFTRSDVFETGISDHYMTTTNLCNKKFNQDHLMKHKKTGSHYLTHNLKNILRYSSPH